MVDEVENSSLAFFVWRIISTNVSNEYCETNYENTIIVKQFGDLGKNSKSKC